MTRSTSSAPDPRRPLVIAHRGASDDFPENTIEAFVGAIDQGADGIELDVRRSADDVLVVHHDVHLSDGRMIRDVAASELPPWVPTLAEALDAVGETWVNIEVKNHPTDPDFDAEHGISVAVAGLVAAFDAHDRVLVSSFDIDSILRLRHTDSAIPIAWLVWGLADPAQLVARSRAHDLNGINPHDLLVDRGFVTRANEADLDVFVWTVDDPDRIVQLAEFGVTGIITNRPALAVDALGG